MRLLLRYNRRDQEPVDVALTIDGELSVGELADEIARADSGFGGAPSTLTVRVDGPDRQVVLAPGLSIRSGGLRSGQAVSLISRTERSDDTGDLSRRIATAVVVSGPDAGMEFALQIGANQIGRGAGNVVALSDTTVSRAHAVVNVGSDLAELVDLGSTNGVEVNGARVERMGLRATDVVLVGDTTLRVEHHGIGADLQARSPEPGVLFNRPPQVQPAFEPVELETPSPPSQPSRQRFPVFVLLMPVLMAGVLFVVTKQIASVLFSALSPMLMLGSYYENKRNSKRDFEEGKAYYESELVRVADEAKTASLADAAHRLTASPSVDDCLEDVRTLTPRLWCRRPDRPLFLALRFGIGTMPSRVKVKVPTSGDRRMLADARKIAAQFDTVDPVPVTADLSITGTLGIGGHRVMALAAARSAVVQLASLHSPSEVVVAALASSATGTDWDWLKWLPHTSSPFSPLDCDHLNIGEKQCLNLVEALERVIFSRMEASRSERAPGPAIVVIIEEGAPVPRSRLVPILEHGRACGVHGVWLASAAPKLPAPCHAFVEIEPSGSASVGLIGAELQTSVARLELVSAEDAELFARRLACVVDAGAEAAGEIDLPAAVSYLDVADIALASEPSAVVERWRESNSIKSMLPPFDAKRPANTLRATVGAGMSSPMVLDLRTNGPHALVAGTTGAGKSEFLQTWVVAMATTHSPERVTFLLVDYKGGAAFSVCDKLPHTVGLVTDLSPHLVRRAMQSLRAELHYRERLLERKKFKDLLEMERTGDAETPPSLVIVVDEFAALSKEVPEFVDGIVNVAQRGRSLGLHLVLATQRPAGVITDNIRANTNLRISLRVADTSDSQDVIGVPTAGTFDPSIPGRGIAKLGPSKLVPFQTGYIGGWTTPGTAQASVHVTETGFGRSVAWEVDRRADVKEAKVTDPTDIQRVVANVQQAAVAVSIPDPRRPWLPDLEPLYDISERRSARDGEISIGVLDDPDHQDQRAATIDLDRDGSIAIFGTGGSGKSTLLRTIAASAALAETGGPVHVYGLDFGGRGLDPLADLPCVGSIVAGDDTERGARLVRMLRRAVNERAHRFARSKVASLDEFRKASGEELPRIILLLDNFAAFTQVYDVPDLRWAYEDLLALVGEGRAVGVHFVISADRRASMPPSRVSVQRRIVLRLVNADEYGSLDAPTDVLTRESPPGRGLLDGYVIQIAVPIPPGWDEGAPTINDQAATLHGIAERLRAAHPTWTAPPVPSLPEHLALSDPPSHAGNELPIGLCDDGAGGLGPASVPFGEPFLIVGPRRSGRSTALATIAAAYKRVAPTVPHLLVEGTASPLAELTGWAEVARTEDAAEKVLADLADRLAVGGSGLRALVIIDDANLLAGGAIEGPMERLLRLARDGAVAIVAAAEVARVNDAYSSFLKPIRQTQQGLILQADASDPDVFGSQLPRSQRSLQPPGRGLLIAPTSVRRVQVGMTMSA